MMLTRRVLASLAREGRCFSSSASHHADFTHAVIGAGAVGLAIARRLQQVEGAQVVLIEKHGMVGSETSSRNSEAMATLLTHDHLLTYTRSSMLASTMVTTRSKQDYAYKAKR